MKTIHYNVIGMMSGTSLDGIDLAEIGFAVDNGWRFEIKSAETIPYSVSWRKKLQAAVQLSPAELEALDAEYSVFLAEVIAGFIRRNNINTIDAVCTHGHTVFHQPQKGITLQIGNTPELARRLGHTVVCDFRTQDVALGGQGAPLVPIGDRLLFPQYDYCLNLGGFANVSFDDERGNRIAFDICPANIVLNHYASQLGKTYDRAGKEASAGKVNRQLLDALNRLEFYALPPPKSLGIEWVKAAFLPRVAEDIAVRDILCTLVKHIAMQISGVFKKGA
ncbi:MAG: anhydro-N-acetylmuramic acid kinase, partial [Sinomicrobium sp.]|nr:anhydro-N-acetylmuramic acid kinase [Sinomicrobium sp.]